jgi:hypothetical protein
VLPDGLFSNQKSQFGYILEGLRLDNVNIFYDHKDYFTDIWDDILSPFGTFCVLSVNFSGFGVMGKEKSGNPAPNHSWTVLLFFFQFIFETRRSLVPTDDTSKAKLSAQVSICPAFCVSATSCASPKPRPSIFTDYSFWVHHLVNWDDQQFLAHAMASDFSVAWQCL